MLKKENVIKSSSEHLHVLYAVWKYFGAITMLADEVLKFLADLYEFEHKTRDPRPIPPQSLRFSF